MEKIKKARAVQRTAFTRTYNLLAELLSKSKPDKIEIEANLHLLEQKFETLKDLDKQVLDNLLNSDCDEDEMDSEIATADEYTNKYNKMKISLKGRSNKEAGDSIDIVHETIHWRKKLKLPVIELTKFGGDVKEWLSFWSQFRRIHEDSEIETGDKFQYLLQATVPQSRARQLVESYPPTAENYEKVIDSLKSRFGRDDFLIEVYVRELLSLVLNNLSNKVKLSYLFDEEESRLRALETLGVTSETCAAMLYPLVESCLPEELLRVWQRSSLYDSELSLKDRLNNLMSFLGKEVENEERISLAVSGFQFEDAKESSRKRRDNIQKEQSVPTASDLVNHKSPMKCAFCNDTHTPENYSDAKKLTLAEKSRILSKEGCCFACLKYGHVSRKCRVRLNCTKCNGKHVDMMCPGKGSSAESSRNNKELSQVLVHSDSLSNHTYAEVFLQTLVVEVIGEGRIKYVRALIDTGSQRSYICERTAIEMQYISIREEKMIHALFGGTESECYTHECYRVTLNSKSDKYSCNFEVLDQNVICTNVTSVKDGPWIEELKDLGIEITDRNNGPIEILIGADVAAKVITGRRVELTSGLVALETLLGWTLMGKVPHENPIQSSMLVTTMFSSQMSVADLWELNVLGIIEPNEKKSKREHEHSVLEQFLQTISINENGRYEVKMPWVEGHPPLPDNICIAKRRLDSLVEKLRKDGYFEAYQQVFQEWLEEGIIEPVPNEDLDSVGHYLPHRHVIKLSSATTKIRPVFDASCKGKNSPSLNQCLEKGLNFIELIPSILLRFRIHQIGVISDIKKAFLQISLAPTDRDYLRFFWYDDSGELRVFRHTRAVFGVTCSPFILAAVMEYHLQQELGKTENEASIYPAWVISKLMRSFYVDNCVVSVDNEKQLDEFIKVSSDIMMDAKFDLRGWEHTSMHETNDYVKLTPVLGLIWDTQGDVLALGPECFGNIQLNIVTKRTLLSAAHRLFDPIGFICPTTLVPILLIQRTWKSKIGWDVEVEDDIKTLFLQWVDELHFLTKLKIPRWLNLSPNSMNRSLHIFCDASHNAYATAIFLRSETDQQVHVSLIQDKSRVAPIKTMTIPRLELMAAVIGVRLANVVMSNFDIEGFSPTIFYWTDSTTVLSWIKREEKWKTFVWNRVQEIKMFSKTDCWYHVPGDVNPADLPSRGCSPKKLLQSLWWEGPSWLRKSPEEWPNQKQIDFDEGLVNEEKRQGTTSLMSGPLFEYDNWYYKYFSKFNDIVKLIGWIKRFCFNCRNGNQRRNGGLVLKEIIDAETLLMKLIQRESFDGVNDQKLSSLFPFEDDDGVIRLTTKISHRSDFPEFRYPIVLPNKHPVVTRLIFDSHVEACHVGVQGLLSIMREKFWILCGRRTIKSVKRGCVVCSRYDAKSLNTAPTPLPANRVNEAATFEITGVDLAGPLFLQNGKKVWICIFTCAVYRGIHLELVSSLSTTLFLEAFRRFVARRGRPAVIYSDNGTTFVGAENAFRKPDWTVISEYSMAKWIVWKFNPVSAPWWGGWWERLIRIVKQILRKVLGRASLTFEELSTILCDCESVINSRPITYVAERDKDLVPLTPNMFLHSPKINVEIPDVDLIESTALNRSMKYRQTLRDIINRRFRNEYLGELMLHSKRDVDRKIEIGDIVLIGNEKSKRLDWPLGIIEEVIPGKDGNVRVVRLKTSIGQLVRPLQRIYPLEVRTSD